MQMLKVEDEDGVSVRANTSKKKKKRKPKKSLKLTPLSSEDVCVVYFCKVILSCVS